MENGDSAAGGDSKPKPQAVSFMIGFDERPSKQLPKRKAHVLAQHQRGRMKAKEMTEEDLAEKQRRADERRKVEKYRNCQVVGLSFVSIIKQVLAYIPFAECKSTNYGEPRGLLGCESSCVARLNPELVWLLTRLGCEASREFFY